MKKITSSCLSILLVLSLLITPALAGAQTFTGSIMCAKCKLQKADAKSCQDVLVVDNGTEKAEYYIEKNSVAEEFGHVCSGDSKATVTGEVTEKDGKTWISPSKMEKTS